MYSSTSKRTNALKRTASSSLRPSRKLDGSALTGSARKEQQDVARLSVMEIKDRLAATQIESEKFARALNATSHEGERKKIGQLLYASQSRAGLLKKQLRSHATHASQMQESDLLSRAMRDVLPPELCERVIARKMEIEAFVAEHGCAPERLNP